MGGRPVRGRSSIMPVIMNFFRRSRMAWGLGLKWAAILPVHDVSLMLVMGESAHGDERGAPGQRT